MEEEATVLQACLTDIDRIERGASKVADGPLRPHKALCKVLKRQAGNLEDALDGSGNTARIRELRDSLAAARSLVEGFSSDDHHWVQTYWTSIDKSADFAQIFSQLNAHLEQLGGPQSSYESSFCTAVQKDQKDLRSIIPEIRRKYASEQRAEHLTETERIHVQQQWAMCNIIALRTEYIAESKGPFLAELVEQDFSVEHTLGRGTFGQVHLGRLFSLPVAIKTLDADASDGSTLAGLLLEATILAGLQHPCLVQQYGYNRDSWHRFQLLQQAAHASLHDELRTGRLTLTAQDACQLLLQIAQGLAYLHAHDSLHGNLNLANVMLAADEGLTIKLCDYGRESARAAIRAGRLHSVANTAPEVLQGLPASPAADIFAFGKLGQQLLSSRDKPSGSEAAPAGMLTGLQLLLEACCSTDATSRPSATYLESHLRCILQPTHQGDCQNGIPTEPSPFALTDLRQEQPVGQGVAVPSAPPILHTSWPGPSNLPQPPPNGLPAMSQDSWNTSRPLLLRSSARASGSGHSLQPSTPPHTAASDGYATELNGFSRRNAAPAASQGSLQAPLLSSSSISVHVPYATPLIDSAFEPQASDNSAGGPYDMPAAGLQQLSSEHTFRGRPSSDSFTSLAPTSTASMSAYCPHEDEAKIRGLVKMLKKHPDEAERAKCCDSLIELAAESGNLEVLYRKAMPVLVSNVCTTRCTDNLAALMALMEKEGGRDAFMQCKPGLKDINAAIYDWIRSKHFRTQPIRPVYRCLLLLSLLPGASLRSFKGVNRLLLSLNTLQQQCNVMSDPDAIKAINQAESLRNLIGL